jgi:hypothetical protein
LKNSVSIPRSGAGAKWHGAKTELMGSGRREMVGEEKRELPQSIPRYGAGVARRTGATDA